MQTRLSWTAARRIAVRAQGIGRRRRFEVPSRAASRRSLVRTLEATHLLQIDAVNVFARAHLMPTFTRSGSWDVAVLERATRPGPGRLAQEALAHEATFATADVYDLLWFRRALVAAEDWGRVRQAATSGRDTVAGVMDALATHGPLSAAALARTIGDHERPGTGWGWRRTDTQWLVEYLFRSGRIDCVGRNERFERVYTTPTAWEVDGVAPVPEPEEVGPAVRDLVALAAHALGIATEQSIADYFRLRVRDVREHLPPLIRAGRLHEVRVRHPEGDLPMLLSDRAPRPAPLDVATLVSPFDPLIFHRPRLEQLFDVVYRIGIYTPQAQRTHGYYALPFLLGDRIVARVDLRADRRRGVLEVRQAHTEELPMLRGRDRVPDAEDIATPLAGELWRAATWQRLEAIEVSGIGDLAPALAAAVTNTRGTGRDREEVTGVP